MSGGRDDTGRSAKHRDVTGAETLTEQPSAPQIAPSAPVEPQRRRSRWRWCTSNRSRANRSASTASRNKDVGETASPA
ncbi:hypothetical protein M8494_06085 [Serratia ureilytica]